MGIIETHNICFTYSNAKRLSMDEVCIDIKKGVKTVVLGSNGAGKSTLFYHFNGILRPDKGDVCVDGEPISYRRKGLKKLRSKVAIVLQNPDDQIFGQTVEADVGYGPANMKLPHDEVKRRTEEAMFLTGITELREKNTNQLSYGQRKRVALAGAIAMRPEVLIMDEPTAGLDPQMALDVMELAEQMHNSGTTVVISTHDVDLAYAWAEEIHVIRYGKLIYSGPSEGFYGDPVLVNSTGVMQPSMYVINKGLAEMKDLPEEPYPHTESQLISKIVSGQKGSMRIIPMKDKLSDEMLALITDRPENCTAGVFGMITRRYAADNKLPLEYVFNGFESCASDCLKGKDSLLVCDEDCLNLIEKKIDALKWFGTNIQFTIL